VRYITVIGHTAGEEGPSSVLPCEKRENKIVARRAMPIGRRVISHHIWLCTNDA